MERTELNNDETDVDAINDIVDYLVRCAKISFKNSHYNESDVRTSDKIQMAHELYTKSPAEFLMQFGKYLAPAHIGYFEKREVADVENERYRKCIEQLKYYHSDHIKHKRVRNRRYKALQKLQDETDYFSEKQMMFRNPLLYEQLVGQYLTREEINDRDGIDRENLTFLNMILETVDRNQMREMKNEQMLKEDIETCSLAQMEKSENFDDGVLRKKKHWGDFETPDTTPNYMPEPRKQSIINASEKILFREEFLQEMYSSFLDGGDADVDYDSIDNDEQYDDLLQVSQDAEDKYFDSEVNDIDNLEEHMKLVQEYGRKDPNHSISDDSLDTFMKHLSN